MVWCGLLCFFSLWVLLWAGLGDGLTSASRFQGLIGHLQRMIFLVCPPGLTRVSAPITAEQDCSHRKYCCGLFSKLSSILQCRGASVKSLRNRCFKKAIMSSNLFISWQLRVASEVSWCLWSLGCLSCSEGCWIPPAISIRASWKGLPLPCVSVLNYAL